jgi:hypothetical protein
MIFGHLVATSRHQSFDERASDVAVVCTSDGESRCGGLRAGVAAGLGDLVSTGSTTCGHLSTTLEGELPTTKSWLLFGELQCGSFGHRSGDVGRATEDLLSGETLFLMTPSSSSSCVNVHEEGGNGTPPLNLRFDGNEVLMVSTLFSDLSGSHCSLQSAFPPGTPM